MPEKLITVTLTERESRLAVQAIQELQTRVSVQGQSTQIEECRSASQKIIDVIHEEFVAPR